MTIVTRRTLARRTTPFFMAVAALGAIVAHGEDASAAELLTCTGDLYDLRAELNQTVNDGTSNNLKPFPEFNVLGGNPNANGGRLDDGSVRVNNALLSQIFPAGIPFISTQTEMFVNANGNLSFEDPQDEFTPFAIPGLDQPDLAVFFGDVDLRPAGSTMSLCVEPDNDRLFVTWTNVGYFNQKVDKLNAFQVVLTNNDATVCLGAANFEVEFRYNQLQWTTGDHPISGGTNGLGGNEASAGIDSGDGVNAVELPGSQTPQVLDLVTGTNVDDPGVFRFLVAQGTLPSCGNGTTQLCEQCDDGDQDNGDACTNLCQNARCGDGLLQDGVEVCDIDQLSASVVCPPGSVGTPLCNNDPDNPTGNNTCTFDNDGCTDVDECADPDDNDCDVNATCTNAVPGYDCTCNSGYEGDGEICLDVDECLDDALNNCDPNATCGNTPGSFTCTCNDGFEGNGFLCEDIDECAADDDNNCDENATCTNTVPGFDCECNDGFSGDGVVCTPDGTGGGGQGGNGNGGNGNGGNGNGGNGNGGNGQGGSGNGGNGQGGSGNGGNGNGGSGNGGNGDGGNGNGGNGDGGNGNGGSPSGSTANASSGVDNGSSGTLNGSTGALNGSTGANGDGDGGSGDGFDAVASGGWACAVRSAGQSDDSKGALALLALAGAVVVSRRRKG